MPRVRFLTDVAGPGTHRSAGEVVDLPAEQATVWADGVRAEYVRDAPPSAPERATRRPERAVRGHTGAERRGGRR